MARRRAAAPVAEPEEVFEEIDDTDELDELEDVADDDIEELTDDVEPEPEPTPKRRGRPAKAAPAPAPAKATKTATKASVEKAASSDFDSNWLAEHIGDVAGVEMDGRSVRMLLRKLAKEGVLEREIGTDRSRYTFPKGANDPIVKRVVALVKSGNAADAKATKTEGIAAAKATKATKAAPAAARRTAPAKAATKAAPAKAATATRRRRAAVAE